MSGLITYSRHPIVLKKDIIHPRFPSDLAMHGIHTSMAFQVFLFAFFAFFL